jgi:hypothetical protein
MLLANELRIGNWLQSEMFGVKQIFQVTPLHIKILYKDSPGIYSPIPLTPEILQKAGFDKEDLFNTWYLNLFQMVLDDDGTFYSSYMPEAVHVKYVHQVQNLYYALTGQELQINL